MTSTYRIHPQPSFNFGGLVIDNFAGGGGASTGIETALGRQPGGSAAERGGSMIIGSLSLFGYRIATFSRKKRHTLQGNPIHGVAYAEVSSSHPAHIAAGLRAVCRHAFENKRVPA